MSGKQVHCRHKNNQSSCKEGLQAPQLKVETLLDKDFSNHSEQPIQIKPQKVKLTLRKGEQFNLTFQYKMTENFPVDLYYLMDFSNSMRSHKEKLAELGNKLAEAMRKLTTNFRLGFGSFVDKVELPYTATEPQR